MCCAVVFLLSHLEWPMACTPYLGDGIMESMHVDDQRMLRPSKSINKVVATNQDSAVPGLTSGAHVDWGSVITEDATQNAALAAIMFLAGGLGKGSPHCIITLVGSDPVVRPLLLDQQQAQQMLQTRADKIEHEEVSLHVSPLECKRWGLQNHAAAQLCHSG